MITKEKIDNIIGNCISEIIKGSHNKIVTNNELENEFKIMLSALQAKNYIYDYAIKIDYNTLFNSFEGKLAYSLINTSNIKDPSPYENLIEFTIK